MDYRDKVKHVSDIPTDIETLKGRKPFNIREENQRRFVRLEISAPMSMQKIKDTEGGLWPEGDGCQIDGVILNISAGGLLVDLNQVVGCGDIVSMHFTIQDVEVLDNVLGLVKRADVESDGCIAGIEFVSAGYLMDNFSEAEMELITEDHRYFDDSVHEVLSRYICHQRLEQEVG